MLHSSDLVCVLANVVVNIDGVTYIRGTRRHPLALDVHAAAWILELATGYHGNLIETVTF